MDNVEIVATLANILKMLSDQHVVNNKVMSRVEFLEGQVITANKDLLALERPRGLLLPVDVGLDDVKELVKAAQDALMYLPTMQLLALQAALKKFEGL